MTAVAANPGVLTVRRLDRDDVESLTRFLGSHPVAFVYPLGWLYREGIVPRAPHIHFAFHGAFEGGPHGRLVGATLLAGRVLLFVAAHEVDVAKCLAANPNLPVGGFKVMVGPKATVDAAFCVLSERGFRARLQRSQSVYAVRSDTLKRLGPSQLRVADRYDVETILVATTEMHTVETLEMPTSDEVAVFRRSIEYQVAQRRIFVVTSGATERSLRFKASICALTEHVAQVEGVWVPPFWRRLGYAKTAMSQLCAGLLERVGLVSLYVNDGNEPAIRLYEDALGFEYELPFKTVFLLRP